MFLFSRTILGTKHTLRKRIFFKIFQFEHNATPTMSTLVLKEAKQQNFEPPSPEGTAKNYSPKIMQIVDQIANMSLLEVADLNEALKKRLNVPDMPMSYGMVAAMPSGAAGPAKAEEAKEDEAVAAPVKTSFTVKLVKFNEAKKIDLIKEIKNSVPNTNLVQAKKIVESLPQTLKKDVGKGEADKLKEALEKCGGTCEIE